MYYRERPIWEPQTLDVGIPRSTPWRKNLNLLYGKITVYSRGALAPHPRVIFVKEALLQIVLPSLLLVLPSVDIGRRQL